eukprot:10019679-Ditylum_brightwellii.AAC.1
MEMAENLKNEDPADDDVEAKKLKGLLWNSMPFKDVQSQVESSSTSIFATSDQVIDTATSGSVLVALENLVLGLCMQKRNECLSNMAIPASSGNFTSNNSVGGPVCEVEFLDIMEL